MTRFVSAEGRQSGRGVPMVKVSHAVADTGTLAVFSAADVAHVVFQKPLTREEAVSEARDGVESDLGGMLEHPNPLVALPMAAVAVPLSLWKQGVAVASGVSSKKLRDAEAKLRAAAIQTHPHEELALQVAQQLAPRTSQFVVLEREPVKPGTGGTAAALLRCALSGSAAGLPTVRTAGSYDVKPAIATLLGIQVQKAALTGAGGANPKLALSVEATVILVSSRDGRELYSCPLNYRSQGRRFTEWAAHDAKVFRSELDKCCRELGGAVVDQLISRGLVAPAQRPQATFAQR